MERENEDTAGGRPRLHRAAHLQTEGPSLSWEQFVRESLLQAAWPVALAPLPANSPRRANTLDQQSSASELIARRGVFSRRQYGSVEQLSQAGEGTAEADRSRRFRLENGNSLGEKDELFGPPSAPVLENPEFQTRWYFKYFLGKLHQNYIGLDASREPYLLSVVQEGGLLRAILFNKMGAHKISLGPSAWGAGPERTRPPPKHILSHFPPVDRLDKAPREVTCPEIQKDILLLEEQEGSVNFKIGIIYAKKGQKTDDEMLSNEMGDENFDQFLSLLGERVRLKGWSRFRGGLDVKGDMTGSHAIYTMHQGHEVMFHVSTMLPFSKDNKQQLERKRHIGNDIVNIVFTEDSAHGDFNPLCIKSHFTHIFAVVSTTDCGPEGPGYRLSVFSDDSVPPFGPSLPFPAIFTDPQLFREFLLVKLMNGEKATFQTPTFALKRQRTLDSLIKDIYAEHSSDHKVPMLSRRALSDVWSSGGGGVGGASVAGAARSERFVRSGQALKLDAVLRGDAPTSLASGGMCGARKAPWEAALWRAAPLPAAATCAVALPDGRLLLSTTSNTYLLEESGTTRVVLRWEGCVRQARVAGGAALFRTAGRGAGLLALPLQELAAGAWAMRPHQDCKAQRLPRTKACHYVDTAELDDGRAFVAIAIGRRILLLVQDIQPDKDSSCDFTQIKDFQLSESPLLLRLLEGDAGMLVVGYKQHWEVLDRFTGQPIKRVEIEGSSTGCAGLAGGAGGADEGAGRRGRGRGTLVTALRLGDERDAQLLFCFNHTCHFERLTTDGLQSDSEYNFHWTTVPTAVVCAFPYIMAFAEDLLEIRLVANGSLVHAACIPGLKLLCAEQDIFYLACVPEYAPLREPDFALYCSPAPTTTQEEPGRNKQGAGPGHDDDDTTSASSRSSSVSSEPEVRSPIQRLPQISPPNTPQVTSCHADSSSSGRCVRIYKIPLCNLSAATYQRQSISTDGSNPFCGYRADKLIDSLNDLKLQNARAKQARSSSTAIVNEIENLI